MAVASLLVKAVAKALPARATGVPAWPSAYPCPSAKSVVQNSSHNALPLHLRSLCYPEAFAVSSFGSFCPFEQGSSLGENS